jgi:hypothetical protein
MPSGSMDFDMPEEFAEWAPATINCDDLHVEIENLRFIDTKQTGNI